MKTAESGYAVYALHQPISKNLVKLNDGVLFFVAEFASFNIWPQVIYPTKPTTLATPQQT